MKGKWTIMQNIWGYKSLYKINSLSSPCPSQLEGFSLWTFSSFLCFSLIETNPHQPPQFLLPTLTASFPSKLLSLSFSLYYSVSSTLSTHMLRLPSKLSKVFSPASKGFERGWRFSTFMKRNQVAWCTFRAIALDMGRCGLLSLSRSRNYHESLDRKNARRTSDN